MKINLGCGRTPLDGYVNVDMDTLEDLRIRYPNLEFSDDLIIEQWDIFNLPVDDSSVDLIRSDCLFEHLNFKEERVIFEEVQRVLKPGGTFELAVPDFEHVVKSWLNADDNWCDWYRDDDEAISNQHWFGVNKRTFEDRWGYLTACLFGSQNGEGQYHKNCYTIGKIRKILERLDFEIISEDRFIWPRGCDDDEILRVISKKR